MDNEVSPPSFENSSSARSTASMELSTNRRKVMEYFSHHVVRLDYIQLHSRTAGGWDEKCGYSYPLFRMFFWKTSVGSDLCRSCIDTIAMHPDLIRR